MLKQTKQFLDYAATNNEAVVAYYTSGMILAVHSDASYLSELKACSQAWANFFLSNDTTFPPNNGALLNTDSKKRYVISHGIKIGGTIHQQQTSNANTQHILTSMGHSQPPMPMQADNSTMYGVVSNKIIPKATKAMDMHFHWLRDRQQQQQF